MKKPLILKTDLGEEMFKFFIDETADKRARFTFQVLDKNIKNHVFDFTDEDTEKLIDFLSQI